MAKAKPIPYTKEELWDIFDYRNGILYWKKKIASKIVIGSTAGRVVKSTIRIKIFGEEYGAHRLVWKMHNDGVVPDQIDHKDLNAKNNRIENLRSATTSQNSCNTKTNCKNTSGIKNVSFDKSRNKWRVEIKINKNKMSIGRYNDIELAELVAIEARNKYHGEFANHGGGYIPEVTYPFR